MTSVDHAHSVRNLLLKVVSKPPSYHYLLWMSPSNELLWTLLVLYPEVVLVNTTSSWSVTTLLAIPKQYPFAPLTLIRWRKYCKFFSQVGIPDEILTDQGTNLTLQLLQEVYHLLHIKPIRTTPYHPQTECLVKRFNHTLKMMLKKTAAEGKNWDGILRYLLLAYHEVPQASTGFSPF